jgi:hypothetical protein
VEDSHVLRETTSRGLLDHGCCLFLQYLIHGCARGGRRTVEDMCYEIQRAVLWQMVIKSRRDGWGGVR